MTRDDALSLADHILTLVNGQPRTPTKGELVEAIMSRWYRIDPNEDRRVGCCGDPGDCDDLGCTLRQAYHHGKKEGEQVAADTALRDGPAWAWKLPEPTMSIGTLPAGTEVTEKLWLKCLNDAFDAMEKKATFQAEINERNNQAVAPVYDRSGDDACYCDRYQPELSMPNAAGEVRPLHGHDRLPDCDYIKR
jgi:hypothetical protein